MKLSEEDINILTMERKKREIDAQYSPMPNGEERKRLWKKSNALHRKISALIYDADGNYRKDKRHLLSGGSLDLHLLDVLVRTIDVYDSGHLKGYADGEVIVGGRAHEFLYRICADPENGSGETLVSVDYGYENPLVAKLWSRIAKAIRDEIAQTNNAGGKEDGNH